MQRKNPTHLLVLKKHRKLNTQVELPAQNKKDFEFFQRGTSLSIASRMVFFLNLVTIIFQICFYLDVVTRGSIQFVMPFHYTFTHHMIFQMILRHNIIVYIIVSICLTRFVNQTFCPYIFYHGIVIRVLFSKASYRFNNVAC